MFSTLDPITRKISLPSGRPALLTDTVGFIHKLPPTLVAAFHATLEQISESSLILHVVDITHRNAAEQVSVVERILGDMGLSGAPTVMALNKTDLLDTSDMADRHILAPDMSAGERRRVCVRNARGRNRRPPPVHRLPSGIDRVAADRGAIDRIAVTRVFGRQGRGGSGKIPCSPYKCYVN